MNNTVTDSMEPATTRMPRTENDMLRDIIVIIAEKTGLDPLTIQPGHSLDQHLGIDSLDIFEIILAVEDHFKITIPNEEAEKLRTVGAMANWLFRNLH